MLEKLSLQELLAELSQEAPDQEVPGESDSYRIRIKRSVPSCRNECVRRGPAKLAKAELRFDRGYPRYSLGARRYGGVCKNTSSLKI
jgi:hypothetical protein